MVYRLGIQIPGSSSGLPPYSVTPAGAEPEQARRVSISIKNKASAQRQQQEEEEDNKMHSRLALALQQQQGQRPSGRGQEEAPLVVLALSTAAESSEKRGAKTREDKTGRGRIKWRKGEGCERQAATRASLTDTEKKARQPRRGLGGGQPGQHTDGPGDDAMQCNAMQWTMVVVWCVKKKKGGVFLLPNHGQVDKRRRRRRRRRKEGGR